MPDRPPTRRLTRRAVARASAALGAAALAGAACAPGAGGPSEPAPSGPRSGQPVTLRWSTWGDAANPMAEGAAKGIEIFRQKFPYITVTAEPQVSTPGGPT
ncbi:MAG TPA: hypothetical protein VHQ00_14565, partial [Chloroflexota bacterium]|nr:hypothetical protein [Chloroflexota bacterium]